MERSLGRDVPDDWIVIDVEKGIAYIENDQGWKTYLTKEQLEQHGIKWIGRYGKEKAQDKESDKGS